LHLFSPNTQLTRIYVFEMINILSVELIQPPDCNIT